MRRETRDIHGFRDVRVAEVAERQHGVVSLAQLRAIGLGDDAVEWRARTGRLHRLHRGVYAVGHRRLTERGRMWAGLLACGGPDRAALSHRSAATLWDLVPSPSVIEVFTLGGNRSARGLRVRRRREWQGTTHQGLAVTTVAQTLLDLATTVTEHRLLRIVHRAEHLRLLDMRSVGLLLAEQHGRRGTARLAKAADDLATRDPEMTRSGLEDRFLDLVARHGLPRPLVNSRVLGFEIDFLWPEHRLAVETDGAATHLTAAAFESDRERDVALTAAGYRVVRFTRRRVVRAPDRVAAALRELLSPPR